MQLAIKTTAVFLFYTLAANNARADLPSIQARVISNADFDITAQAIDPDGSTVYACLVYAANNTLQVTTAMVATNAVSVIYRLNNRAQIIPLQTLPPLLGTVKKLVVDKNTRTIFFMSTYFNSTLSQFVSFIAKMGPDGASLTTVSVASGTVDINVVSRDFLIDPLFAAVVVVGSVGVSSAPNPRVWSYSMVDLSRTTGGVPFSAINTQEGAWTSVTPGFPGEYLLGGYLNCYAYMSAYSYTIYGRNIVLGKTIGSGNGPSFSFNSETAKFWQISAKSGQATIMGRATSVLYIPETRIVIVAGSFNGVLQSVLSSGEDGFLLSVAYDAAANTAQITTYDFQNSGGFLGVVASNGTDLVVSGRMSLEISEFWNDQVYIHSFQSFLAVYNRSSLALLANCSSAVRIRDLPGYFSSSSYDNRMGFSVISLQTQGSLITGALYDSGAGLSLVVNYPVPNVTLSSSTTSINSPSITSAISTILSTRPTAILPATFLSLAPAAFTTSIATNFISTRVITSSLPPSSDGSTAATITPSDIVDPGIGQQGDRLNSIPTYAIAAGAGFCVIILLLLATIIFVVCRKPKDATQSYVYEGNDTYMSNTGTTTIAGYVTSTSMSTELGASSYGGATTMMGGQTLLAGENNLSLPGFFQALPNIDFVVKQELARGGGGSVHLAEPLSVEMKERSQNQRVIVKAVFDSSDPLQSLQINKSFEQEVATMYFFRENPHFAKMLGYTANPKMIVMKYYPMGSLDRLIHAREVKWTRQLLMKMAADVAMALKAMHEAGFAHCDLKPGNILIEKVVTGRGLNGVLTDFGITQVVDTKNVVKGFQKSKAQGASLLYAAPEVIRMMLSGVQSENNEPQYVKSRDLYAFAVILLEMQTRERLLLK